MATITGTNSIFDAAYLAALKDAVLGTHDSTGCLMGVGSYLIAIDGTSLSYSSNHPSGGTITAMLAVDSYGGSYAVWEGLSVSASQLWNAISSGNVTTFNNLLYSGNDTFTASGHYYGMDSISGAAGAYFDGGAGNDTFNMQACAGPSSLIGGSGNDTFNFAGNYDGWQSIDGGTGTDTLNLDGEYTGYNTLALTNIETVHVAAGHNYRLAVSQATAVTFDGSALGAANGLYLEGFNATGALSVLGGAGNDTLSSGRGNDIFQGGAGIDTISYEHATSGVTVSLAISSAQSVGGGCGSDTLISVESIIGSSGNDHLTGNASENTFYAVGDLSTQYWPGNDGNDVYDGGSGFDTVSYNLINTNLSGVFAGITVDLRVTTGPNVTGGVGNDTLVSIERVVGTKHNDTFYGDASDNVFVGGGIYYGYDTVDYQNATGGLTITAQDDGSMVVTGGGQGTDTLIDINKIIASAYDDTIALTSSSYVVAGGAGFDTVDYSRANSALNITALDSSLEALIGTGFNDTLRGNTGDDRLDGGAGNDIFYEGIHDSYHASFSGGNDTLQGGAGDDRFYFADLATGTYWVDGGAGADTFDVSLSESGFSIDLSSSTVGNIHITGFENIVGTEYSDTLTGTDGDNVIEGGLGADMIHAGAGNDIIYTSSLEDYLRAGGSDTVYGGAGLDTVVLFESTYYAYTDRTSDGSVMVYNVGGTLSLFGVEYLQFTDKTIFIGKQGADDFSRDMKSDILWRGDDGSIALWRMDGTQLGASGIFAANPGAYWSIADTGDFDNDQYTDILWRGADGEVAIWLMDGDTIRESVVLSVNPGAGWHVEGVGDSNRDGSSDIYWRNEDGTMAIWQMDGTDIAGAALLLANPGPDWAVAAIADFDGAKADVLWRNVTDGSVAIWFMDGAAISYATVLNAHPGTEWEIAGVGDFDGDWRNDILWRNANDGSMALWTMRGSTITSQTMLSAQPGSEWQVMKVGDYDGDGCDDILWHNTTTGSYAVWAMDGASIVSSAFLSNNPGAGWNAVS